MAGEYSLSDVQGRMLLSRSRLASVKIALGTRPETTRVT